MYADAEAAGVWVNSADDPAHCSFILPAVHRDGAVTVSVSTGGLSPALASWLRDRLAAHLEWASGPWPSCSARPVSDCAATGSRSDAVDWEALLDGPLPELVRAGDLDNARAIVTAATAR